MIRLPSRVALTAALASIGALAVPAIASADPTATVQGSVLTVTADDTPDNIVLSVDGAVLKVTVNGVVVNQTPQALTANNEAEIVVNAGGGNDIVDATALSDKDKYKTIAVNGGAGDDTVTGGADIDTLNGELGNDRLVGGKGDDPANGGEGDDVFVWNNGDGTDTNNGGNGTDESEINGNPTAADVNTAKPSVLMPAGWVRFDRAANAQNQGAFGIEFLGERMTVNSLGGDDSFNAEPGVGALTSFTLNGGTGADQLFGGDGADQINGQQGLDALGGGAGADLIRGGDDADTIGGGTGDDRLIGDRGGDNVFGNEGDDVMVWNNGDGSDFNTGGDGFDRTEVNGSAGAVGDVFTLAADAKFQRTNLVPFSVTIDKPTTEAISVNGGGGDDQFTVAPGNPGMVVTASGDAGNDTLTGGDEADSFFGGSGNDTLTGGLGSDLVDGEEGDDKLFARDLAGDLVRGGAGTDSAQTDSVYVDATSSIEALDATPLPVVPKPDPGDTKALLPKLGKFKVVRKGNSLIAQVSVSCPAAEAGGCRTTLALETAKAVDLGGVRAKALLGSKGVRLRAGKKATVSIRLAKGSDTLAKRGKLATRVRVATTDTAGNFAARSVAVGLRIPR